MNEKNHTPLRDKIIALVAEHPRYPHDLYDARSTLTRTQFRQLPDEMHRAGDIRINANNLVRCGNWRVLLSQERQPTGYQSTLSAVWCV